MKPSIRQAKMSEFYWGAINLGVHHFINNNYLVVKENKDDTFLKLYIRSKLKHSKDKDGNFNAIIIDEEDYNLIKDYKIVICNSTGTIRPIIYCGYTVHRSLSVFILELPTNFEGHTSFSNGNIFDCRKENMLYSIKTDYFKRINYTAVGNPIRKVTNKDHTQMFFLVTFKERFYFDINLLGEEEAARQAIEKRKSMKMLCKTVKGKSL